MPEITIYFFIENLICMQFCLLNSPDNSLSGMFQQICCNCCNYDGTKKWPIPKNFKFDFNGLFILLKF